MNEYEKLFYADIREKKVTATGARHKATRGKKSFTVHHQSDNLTAKQRRELSSPVITYKDYPLTLNELNEMSKEEQIAYIEFVMEKYNASSNKIGQMLGISESASNRLMHTLGIELRKRKMSSKQIYKWKEFLEQRNKLQEPVEDNEDTATEIEQDEVNKFNLSLFSSTASITLQSSNKETLKDEVARAISFVLPDGCRYKVTIEVL